MGIGKRQRGNKEELKKWQWFPEKTGKLDQLKLADSFKSLEEVKDQFSILGGLSHPHCRWLAPAVRWRSRRDGEGHFSGGRLAQHGR